MFAASVGQPEVLQLLIDRKADLTKRDKTGRTALHYCCRGGNVQNLRVLLEAYNALPGEAVEHFEKRSNGGVTPLMDAIQSANKYLVGECLNASFDPFAKDFAGNSCLGYSKQYRNVQL